MCKTVQKKVLNDKKEWLMINDADKALGNLLHINFKRLPKRRKLACQNEIHVIFRLHLSTWKQPKISRTFLKISSSKKNYTHSSFRPTYADLTASSQNNSNTSWSFKVDNTIMLIKHKCPKILVFFPYTSL